MQWLTDLIIDTLGIPPCYVPSLYPGIAHFTQVDLTIDEAYHKLELGSILPAGASAANISIRATCDAAGELIRFRHPDDARMQGRCILWTQAAGVTQQEVWAQGVDNLLNCEYYISNANWPMIQILIKGWWL